jgi:hypothetical protein
MHIGKHWKDKSPLLLLLECGMLSVFSAEVRKSEAVALDDPVMPVFDCLSG